MRSWKCSRRSRLPLKSPTIEQLARAWRVRAKKRKVVRHEETIKKLTEEFTGGVRTLQLFLAIV